MNSQTAQVANAIEQLMMLMFMGNIVSPVLLPQKHVSNKERAALLRADQLERYCHSLSDIRNIANRQGIVKLYHGAPTEFAELLVKRGPRVPYDVETIARYVARTYRLSWVEFRPYVYRLHEVMQKLSTAPAPVAARWAWSFPLGEVLTDLNSHARMLVESKILAKARGVAVDDAYEELYNRAENLAREMGTRCTSDNAPDVLGLPDLLALRAKTGALVELEVDARAISEFVALSAWRCLTDIDKGYLSVKEAIAIWNYEYKDIRIAPSSIKSARIVIRNMQPWEQDLVEDIFRKRLSLL